MEWCLEAGWWERTVVHTHIPAAGLGRGLSEHPLLSILNYIKYHVWPIALELYLQMLVNVWKIATTFHGRETQTSPCSWSLVIFPSSMRAGMGSKVVWGSRTPRAIPHQCTCNRAHMQGRKK